MPEEFFINSPKISEVNWGPQKYTSVDFVITKENRNESKYYIITFRWTFIKKSSDPR